MTFLAALSSNALIDTVIHLTAAGLLFWLIWWFITWIGLPQPFLKVVQVILGVAALIYLARLIQHYL